MSSNTDNTLKEATMKMEAFCVYQDRCKKEVLEKLKSFQLSDKQKSKIIDHLIFYSFLNEQRFSESYVTGKFRIKKWGRIKIRQGLISKGVSKEMIKNAIDEIDPDAYYETLKNIAERKWNDLDNQEPFQRKVKTLRFLASRGYEQDLCFDVINILINE